MILKFFSFEAFFYNFYTIYLNRE